MGYGNVLCYCKGTGRVWNRFLLQKAVKLQTSTHNGVTCKTRYMYIFTVAPEGRTIDITTVTGFRRDIY